jgi:hypothetical protein
MAATAAARRVAATPARRATASRQALKPRPRSPQPRRITRSGQARPSARARGGAAAPARRSRRSQVTPIGGFVPLAVGRTAGAVGGIADSGLVVRLTRGRLWIGLLGCLLVGIVALNVWALSLNASSSKIAAQTDGLKRANSALRARLAGELSNEEVLGVASKLGLIYPEPNTIHTLKPGANVAALAAKRLANGELTVGSVTPVPVVPTDVAPDTAVAPVEETAAVTDPAVTTDPAAAAPATVAPTSTATATAGAGGGIGAGGGVGTP